MFLTQTDSNNFKTSINVQRSKSTIRKKYSKLGPRLSDNQRMEFKKTMMATTISTNDRKKQFRFTNPQRKWNKIVDLFNLPEQSKQDQQQIKLIRPGIAFYKLFINGLILKKYELRINFPETYMEFNGDLIQIRTDQTTGLIQSRKIQRENYTMIMSRCLEKQIKKIENVPTKYKKYYDYRHNGFAPVIVTKTADQFDTSFDVDIEHYKNFNERRSRPSGNKLVQRFIYSRNMKAMVMRICFKRKKQNQQREQFCAFRFQNIDNIFRANKKNNQIYQTFKAQSTITATYTRQDKIEYSKITNMKGLQKYTEQSKQLIKFLQRSQKIKINEIMIDFVIDLLDKPWVINLKKIDYEEFNNNLSLHHSEHSLHITGGYGMCRLCSTQYLKVFLKKSISNKMLCQFLEHLRKRLKVSQYQSIDFICEINKKNTKNYITLQVCQGCYRLVVEQFKLIQAQKKLAKICNIQTEQELYFNQMRSRSLNTPSNLKQWRLMLYFVGISNIPHEFIKDQQDIVLRYRLGNIDGIQHSWKIKTLLSANSSSFNGNFNIDLNIKKIKIHYFYSESMNIDSFLKQTQINLQLATFSTQKIFAKGSSGIISCFGRQFQPDLCLRQTSSILLFYNSGQYCQMTFKVGIICDGAYNLPENISLKPLNKVYFSENNFSNSNPIPQQWMQAFGVSEHTQIPQINYQDIMKPEIDENLKQLMQWPEKKRVQKTRKRSNITRKSMHLFR